MTAIKYLKFGTPAFFALKLSYKKYLCFRMSHRLLGLKVGRHLLATPKITEFINLFTVYHIFLIGGIGLGPAAHRYFSHRAFKATRAFKLFLIFCQTVAGQVN